jgi:hypothetical protein
VLSAQYFGSQIRLFSVWTEIASLILWDLHETGAAKSLALQYFTGKLFRINILSGLAADRFTVSN